MHDKAVAAEKIKLRLVEKDASAIDQAPEQSLAMPATTGASPNLPLDVSKLDCKPRAPRSKAELLRILGDPHAPEADWVQASHELEAQGGLKITRRSPPGRRRRIFLGAALISAAVGCFGLLTQSWLQPSHQAISSPAVQAPTPLAMTAMPDVDYGPYLTNMERKIKMNWHPLKDSEGYKVKVHFKIGRDGSMSDLHIIQPGNSAEANVTALTAVSNASSGFEPLPAGAPENVKVEFTFQYNVFNSHRHPSQEWH